jgi:hypothetical protein
MEGFLTVPEQIKVALDGRTQKWLCLEVKISEQDMCARMKGRIPFTLAELTRINARLKSSVKDYPQPAENVFPSDEAVKLTA